MAYSDLTASQLFGYDPSLAAAAAALALFLLGGLAVLARTEWRRPPRRAGHLVTLTALAEAAGYAAMLYCIQRSGKGSIFYAFMCQQARWLCALLSPNLLQAAMYCILGAVLGCCPQLGKGRRCLRGRCVSCSFVLADVFAFIVQNTGMAIFAMAAMGSDSQDMGDRTKLGGAITLVGLALQLLFFAVFTSLVIWVHRHPSNTLVGRPETTRLFAGLYISMALLTIRNVFRFVEFAQTVILSFPQPDGAYIISHQQVLLYCLDAIPILLSVATYAACHPGWLLPPRGCEHQVAPTAGGGGPLPHPPPAGFDVAPSAGWSGTPSGPAYTSPYSKAASAARNAAPAKAERPASSLGSFIVDVRA